MSLIKKAFFSLLLAGTLIFLSAETIGNPAEISIQKVLGAGVDVDIWAPAAGAQVNINGGYGTRGYRGGYYRQPYYYTSPYDGYYYYSSPYPNNDCHWQYTNGFWIYSCP